MSSGIEGKIALVTASAGVGLGRAVARRLAAEGAVLVVTDIHQKRTSDVAEAMATDFPGTKVVGIPLDAGNPEEITSVIETVSREMGPIQVLVNNAAVNSSRTVLECSLADWNAMLAVNLTGPWLLSHLVMPIMKAAGGGVIINVSSYAPDLGIEGPYAIGKGGLNVLTRACAREGGPDGIRAVTVSTGYIADTKWSLEHSEQLKLSTVSSLDGTYPSCAEIAELIVFLVSDHARHITGEVVNVSGGAYMRN